MTDCPFCQKLLDPSWPAAGELVWRFPSGTAVLGPWQFYRGYCILVARGHHSELWQLAEPQRNALMRDVSMLAEAIARAFAPRKLNYELLGNQVPHLHWHLLPRYANDADCLRPAWVAIDRTEHDPTEKARLQATAVDRGPIVAGIRAALETLQAPEMTGQP